MSRTRIALVVLVAAMALSIAPAFAQQGSDDDVYVPAVVVEEPAAPEGDEAWTFRFLVPTLLVATGAVVVGIAVGYGMRVRGRYRVVQ